MGNIWKIDILKPEPSNTVTKLLDVVSHFLIFIQLINFKFIKIHQNLSNSYNMNLLSSWKMHSENFSISINQKNIYSFYRIDLTVHLTPYFIDSMLLTISRRMLRNNMRNSINSTEKEEKHRTTIIEALRIKEEKIGQQLSF